VFSDKALALVRPVSYICAGFQSRLVATPSLPWVTDPGPAAGPLTQTHRMAWPWVAPNHQLGLIRHDLWRHLQTTLSFHTSCTSPSVTLTDCTPDMHCVARLCRCQLGCTEAGLDGALPLPGWASHSRLRLLQESEWSIDEYSDPLVAPCLPLALPFQTRCKPVTAPSNGLPTPSQGGCPWS
jgi:hypothetical protein